MFCTSFVQNSGAVENCMAVAGFSVGEITALIFTGAISFSEGITLVKIRGEAMQV
jgi:[acyl-carrier-protein] S-malonyltransferase